MAEKNHQKYVLKTKQTKQNSKKKKTTPFSTSKIFLLKIIFFFKGNLTKNCCLTENELFAFLEQFTGIPFDALLYTILLR